MIISASDMHNGLFYGSTVHKALSNLEYRPRDIDIMFPSMEKSQSFYMCLCKERVLTTTLHSSYAYAFSEHLVFQQNKMIRLEYGYDTYFIHTCVVDMSGYSDDQSQSNFIKFCLTKVLPIPFLQNVYHDKCIYHSLQDVANVNLEALNYSRYVNASIRKYTIRGVKFTLVDFNRNSIEQLTKAKDSYRSLGLVVIPLSRNDKDIAGKCPAVANWQSLSPKFDFHIVHKCTNIGIVCGQASGIVCIDVDAKDLGVVMFNKMIEKYGIPNGPMQQTGNGGFHYIFKYDHTKMSTMQKKIKCPKLDGSPVGVDMWIQDCQFVATPSINYANGKSYKWIRPIVSIESIPEMPEWIYLLYKHENITKEGLIIMNESVIEPIVESIIDSESSYPESSDSESSVSETSCSETELSEISCPETDSDESDNYLDSILQVFKPLMKFDIKTFLILGLSFIIFCIIEFIICLIMIIGIILFGIMMIYKRMQANSIMS